MKEADLQAANDSVHEAYKRAFAEADRRQHADEATIKTLLDDLLWRLTKLRRERTTPAEVKAAKVQLRSVFSDMAKSQFEKAGSTDPEKVHRAVLQSPKAAKAIFQARDMLLDRQSYEIVKTVVKQGTMTPPAIEKTLKWHRTQPELGFHDIELFRGVPMKIEFVNPETGRIENIPYVQSLDWHRKASLQLHLQRIKVRDEKYNMELKADLALEPYVKDIGDLPAAQLWAAVATRKQPNHGNGA